MFDIEFYMKTFLLNEKLLNGESFNKQHAFNLFEESRNKNPVIYNIETTNACNMKCEMCPRTTMMTRPVETMNKSTFLSIIEQIKPFSVETWEKWEYFAEQKYGISKDEMNENHFFLYIIPKVIQLHGYGDPLLDKNMDKHVKALSDKGIYSYFSCNPSNINIKRTMKMFECGLDYIKYSIESVDDEVHKKIRGNASDFTEGYNKILQLLELKKKNNYKTTIVITMLDLNRAGQLKEFKKLKEYFAGLDVYIYFKSEDQQWYRQDYHSTSSIHWKEICKHPWMSMTIKSNGETATCMEDFNNEIILGDVHKESLYDIWNGEKYAQLRKDHFNLTPDIKCTKECDMKLIGEMNLV